MNVNKSFTNTATINGSLVFNDGASNYCCYELYAGDNIETNGVISSTVGYYIRWAWWCSCCIKLVFAGSYFVRIFSWWGMNIGVGVNAVESSRRAMNVGVGYEALSKLTDSYANTAIGHKSLQNNTALQIQLSVMSLWEKTTEVEIQLLECLFSC